MKKQYKADYSGLLFASGFLGFILFIVLLVNQGFNHALIGFFVPLLFFSPMIFITMRTRIELTEDELIYTVLFTKKIIRLSDITNMYSKLRIVHTGHGMHQRLISIVIETVNGDERFSRRTFQPYWKQIISHIESKTGVVFQEDEEIKRSESTINRNRR